MKCRGDKWARDGPRCRYTARIWTREWELGPSDEEQDSSLYCYCRPCWQAWKKQIGTEKRFSRHRFEVMDKRTWTVALVLLS